MARVVIGYEEEVGRKAQIISKETFFSNGFIEDDFNSEEFNEDLMYEIISMSFRDDPLIKVRKKEYTPDGFSRIVMYNGVNDKLKCGGSKPAEPFYHIVPDFTPVDITLNNFDKFWNGSMAPFKFIPVANPIIPTNKLFQEDDKSLEISWLNMGFNIYDPTPGQEVAIKRKFNEILVNDSNIYLDRYNLVTQEVVEENPDKVFVHLEFNPTHPNSLHRIHDCAWKGNVCTGHWKYRNKVSYFRFDMDDKRYRLHSHEWLQYFTPMSDDTNEFLRCYDMVSIVDFVKLCEFKIYNVMKLHTTVKIQPFTTTRQAVRPYSVIGPWEGEISWDLVHGKIYVPYQTDPMDTRDVGYTYCKPRFRIDGEVMTIYHKMDRFRVSLEKGIPISTDIFRRITPESDEILFRCSNVACRKKYNFVKIEHHIETAFMSRVLNPRSRKKETWSLINPMDTIDMIEAIMDLKKVPMDRKLNLDKWGIVGYVHSQELVMCDDRDEVEIEFEIKNEIMHANLLPKVDSYKYKHNRAEVSEEEKIRLAMHNYYSRVVYQNPEKDDNEVLRELSEHMIEVDKRKQAQMMQFAIDLERRRTENQNSDEY